MNKSRVVAQVAGLCTMGLLALYGLLVQCGVAGPLGLAAEADAGMPNTPTASGKVTGRRWPNVPVSNVVVSVDTGQSATADINGSFVAPQVPAATRTVTAEHGTNDHWVTGTSMVEPKDVPILMYHEVDETAYSVYWVTTERFGKQMDALEAYGWDTVTLEDFLDYRNGEAVPPDRPIILTFDDGYVNLYDQAYPILQAHGFQATSFLPTGKIAETPDERVSNDWDPPEAPYQSWHLIWSEVQAMYGNGVHFESHTVSHANLDLITDTLQAELEDSKADIEAHLGSQVKFFSYPYGSGVWREEVLETLESAGYEAAVSVEAGVENTQTADLWVLKRLIIHSDVSVDYDPDNAENFFMTVIAPDFPVPNITVNWLHYLDTGGYERIHFAPGETITVRASATNSGPAADVVVSLNLADSPGGTPPLLYDSHLTDPPEDVVVTFAENATQEFEWTWTVPQDAQAGPVDSAVGFHDQHYVLGFKYTGWEYAFTIQPAVTRYVRPGGSGDCGSWDTACELQVALLVAMAGDEIWVQEGVYKPTSGITYGSCQEIRDAFPDAADDDYLIQNGGNVFQVYCADMDSTPVEYLTLRDPDQNYAQYTAGGNSPGEDVRTRYSRVRLLPSTLKIDISDQRDTVSEGSLRHNDGEVVTSMPYGVAMDCRGWYSATGEARIDLVSTPFVVSDTFMLCGWLPGGSWTFSAGNQVVELTGGGHCGFVQPTSPSCMDPPYNDAGGPQPILGLGYLGPERRATFQLKSGVAIYGGFAGGETSREARDWVAHETVLSGDIGVGGDNSDNSYHVVTGSGTYASAVLDGFTITGGNADGSWVSPCGNRCGGGMYNYDNSSPTLTDVTFISNTADYYGGGMFNYDNSSPTLTDVTFISNTATQNGGGMYNLNASSPKLTNVTFSGNTATYGGGGMYNMHSSPTLTDVTFSGNTANSGGGMFNLSSSPTLINVTFSGNNAEEVCGGGMRNSSSSPTLTNCILWGNDAPSGAQIDNLDSTPVIGYSDIQGSGGSLAWDPGLGDDGGGNIDADPLFVEPVDPATAPTTAGNLRLQLTSPAIDAGDNSAVPLGVTTDLAGNPRIGGLVVDMGAYEAGLDLAIVKSVEPTLAGPGQAMTYTLVFSNVAGSLATGVILSDVVPSWVELTGFQNLSGLLVTPTGEVSYTWQVEPLSPGEGGAIALTGVISPGASGLFSLTNRATITATEVDEHLANNRAAVSSTVDADPPLIVAVSPPDEAQGVAVTATLVISFSEAIEPGSLAFTVWPDPGGWSVWWNGPGTAVTLGHDPCGCGTTYTVTVSAAADLLGNPLAGVPYAWRFTTGGFRVYLPLVTKSAP